MISIGLWVLIIGSVFGFGLGVYFMDPIWKGIDRVRGRTS